MASDGEQPDRVPAKPRYKVLHSWVHIVADQFVYDDGPEENSLIESLSQIGKALRIPVPNFQNQLTGVFTNANLYSAPICTSLSEIEEEILRKQNQPQHGPYQGHLNRKNNR